MTRHGMRITMRPPGRIERLWYRRLREPEPLSTGSTRDMWHEKWVRLLPQSWTAVHRRYAHRNGFFWQPCVLCDQPHGGHQSGGTIPDPMKGPGRLIGICPRCTRNRNRTAS